MFGSLFFNAYDLNYDKNNDILYFNNFSLKYYYKNYSGVKLNKLLYIDLLTMKSYYE